ncbi:MAG: DUF308 domain-containing protein [Eubacterium sp.]|nr:DUF308 domain-containing protein [Eubacterium sp.]
MEDKYNDQDKRYTEGTYSEVDHDRVTKAEIAEIKRMDRMSQLKKSKIIAGIMSAVLGAVLLFWPGLTMALLCQFVGAFLGITGVLTALVYFTQPKDSPFRAGSLIAGIPLALIGLFIFLNPTFLGEFIPVFAGVIILMDGLANLMETLGLMKQGYSRWWLSLIFAVLTILLGVLLIMRPFNAVSVIMQAIGIIMLYNGLSDIFIASRIKTEIKDL